MKSIKFLLPLAAVALSGLATASSRQVESRVVQFGDLNLDSRAGVAVLHKRIRNAAESVCGNINTRSFGLRDAYEQCVAEAVAQGVTSVGNPNLSNFHASKGRPSVLASK
jgi:UrcA family protein